MCVVQEIQVPNCNSDSSSKQFVLEQSVISGEVISIKLIKGDVGMSCHEKEGKQEDAYKGIDIPLSTFCSVEVLEYN